MLTGQYLDLENIFVTDKAIIGCKLDLEQKGFQTFSCIIVLYDHVV